MLKIAGLEVVVQTAGEVVVGGVDEVHMLDALIGKVWD